MNTDTEKSITLQLLEDLLFALKKVLPNIHSPLGISHQLLALLADAKFLNHRLKDLENEWEQRLPFGEGDDKDVDWELWKKDFHPEKIKPFLLYLGELHEFILEGDRYPYDDNEMMCPSKNLEYLVDQKYLTEFLHNTGVNRIALTRMVVGLKYYKYELIYALLDELTKLWNMLDLISRVISMLHPNKIQNFYNELKTVYDKNISTKFPFNETSITKHHKNYYLRTYKDILLKSNFIRISIPMNTTHSNYMDRAQDVWQALLDEDGLPDILEVGKYMYLNRRELSHTDLEAYFDYVNILEYLVDKKMDIKKGCQPPKAPINKMSKIVPNHKVFHRKCGAPGRGKDINYESLRTTIEQECLPEITQNYHWFCLWHILLYRKIVKPEAKQTHFIQKMQEWFPNHDPYCSKDSLHIYAASYFKRHMDYTTWNDEMYRREIKNKNGKPKENSNICEELKSICERLDMYLNDFCEHPDAKL